MKINDMNCHSVLEEFNEYYQLLSASNKVKFLKRTLYFLKKIEIDGTPQVKLNATKQYLIASAFIQLTFGLRRYHLKSFLKIMVVHKPYSYKEVGILYHGDTNPLSRKINLVWKVVKRGFDIPDDSLNLALHEFAHAFVIDNQQRNVLQKFFRHKLLRIYLLEAKTEMHRIRAGKTSIFREYGASNLMEFFAVSVEVFFEQTQRFAINNSQLFEKMCALLNQDPRNYKHPPFS